MVLSGGTGVTASIDLTPDDVGIEVDGGVRQNDFSVRLRFKADLGIAGKWEWELTPWVILPGFDWYGPRSDYIYRW